MWTSGQGYQRFTCWIFQKEQKHTFTFNVIPSQFLLHSPTYALTKALVSESHGAGYGFTKTASPHEHRQNSGSQHKKYHHNVPSLYLLHKNRLCAYARTAAPKPALHRHLTCLFILKKYFDCLRGKVWLSGFGFSSPCRGFNLSIWY